MRFMLAIVLIIGFLLIIGCTTPTPVSEEPDNDIEQEPQEVFNEPNRQTYQVVIENNLFMPTDLIINKGDVIEWVNKDKQKRTITFEEGMFDVQLPSGGTAIYTFKQAGQFRYYDQFEPGVYGSIIVN